MNKKERKRRLWKTNFRKQHQSSIWKTIESELGILADEGCLFIAHLASRLSKSKLGIEKGVLVCDDRGLEYDPICCEHFWNTFNGRRFDLSPWSNRRVKYLLPKDGLEFEWYQRRVIKLPDFPRNLIDADVDQLLLAMQSKATGGQLPVHS